MILVDANILLYAYHAGTPQHPACRDWLTEALNGSERIGLPWQSMLAFVRIGSHPRAFAAPLTGPEACRIVATWLARPQVEVVEPGEQFFEHFSVLVDSAQVRGPLVTDAALAAMALEQGARLCTTDRDFRRFDGLKLIDPTAR